MGLVGIGVVTGVPSAWALARSAGRIRSVSDVPPTEVGLVLGAGVRWDGTPSLSCRAAWTPPRRCTTPGRSRRLIVSGSPESRGYSEPAAMRHHLVSHGVPAEAVVLDETGVDTWQSCRRAAGEFGLRELTVISTASTCAARWRCAAGSAWTPTASGTTRPPTGASSASRPAARRREVLATIKAFWYSR